MTLGCARTLRRCVIIAALATGVRRAQEFAVARKRDRRRDPADYPRDFYRGAPAPGSIRAPDGTELIPAEELSVDDIRALLRAGTVEFAVDDALGGPLRWITGTGVFDFWKQDVQQHVADPNGRAYLDEFTPEYFYWARRWWSESYPRTVIELRTEH